MTYEDLRSLAHSFGFDIQWNGGHDLLVTDACVAADAMGKPPNRHRDHEAWEEWGRRFFRMIVDVGATPQNPCMCDKCWSKLDSILTIDGKRLTVWLGPKASFRL
jgi:hypothetical protein